VGEGDYGGGGEGGVIGWCAIRGLNVYCPATAYRREDAMRATHWFIAGMLGFLFSGCASTQTAPTAETRQALAPTGQLRVAFLSGVLYATKDSATGELKGAAVDLGRELARRVGVPFQPVPYSTPAAIIVGAKSADWDVALMGINADRAAAVDFSAPYMEVEQGYLVRAGLPIGTVSDVDKDGIRVGVVEKAGADVFLSGAFKNATLVRAKSVADLYALIDSGKADVIAATKTSLFAEAQKRPGSRVLDGRILVEPVGMGVPKGRNPSGAAYVGKFVEEAKAAGVVKAAIERAALRGVVVAPLK
jgi:polar amino acid transport system substrate-binding protein